MLDRHDRLKTFLPNRLVKSLFIESDCIFCLIIAWIFSVSSSVPTLQIQVYGDLLKGYVLQDLGLLSEVIFF